MGCMIDLRCEACGKRFGYAGNGPADMPPCPRCGFRPSQAKLEADQKRFDDFERLLVARPGPSTCQKQRVAAGLTLRQAAEMLGMSPTDLSAVEQGRSEMTPELSDRMATLYDVGQSLTSEDNS